MKNIFVGCFLLVYVVVCGQGSNATAMENFGIFENQTSIGKPKLKGTIAYNSEKQEYTITGSGINMWAEKDQFQYLYKSIQGDFILRARMKFLGTGVDLHRKIGWIIRENLSGNSAHVNATVHGDGLTTLQYRKSSGGITEEVASGNSIPDIVQLERRGGVYYMSTANFGETFKTVKIEGVHLKNEVFVGLYVCSHNQEVVEKAVFTNVRIIKPVAPDFIEDKDYIGGNMEILNVITGHRKVLFRSAHAVQAPNWVNDDKELLFNSNGYLYKYKFRNKEVRQFNTGAIVNNNNDHVMSFDEKILGISSHNPDDGGSSAIYVMRPKGDSNPKILTQKGVGASYLHGISPDNKTMLFTGKRNGKYDIFGIDIETGKEFQLTDTKNLDDGSEYSPDGKYIYFNSNRTGSMHLWRMDANGKNVKQLTFDKKFKDWFPHISPDGKWIVFISFPPTAKFGEHPFYEQCVLRLMSTDGGDPKIVAYIYGGQGTINVPSWSKDSKRIAFVTNSN